MIKEESEKVEIDFIIVFKFIIFVSIAMILTFSYIIFSEIKDAKKECLNFGGDYQLKKFNHFCNDQPFLKYNDGSWRIEENYEINLSLLYDS